MSDRNEAIERVTRSRVAVQEALGHMRAAIHALAPSVSRETDELVDSADAIVAILSMIKHAEEGMLHEILAQGK